MKTIIKVLFVIFILWMIVGIYLVQTAHPNAEIIMGFGVFFLAFLLMPLFIYDRYREGKYKKYVLNSKEDQQKKL